MLFEAHPEIDIHEMSPLALAFAGDAVLELLVRQRLVETSRLQPGRLHQCGNALCICPRAEPGACPY